MVRLEIDKQKFKEYLEQFIGDAPYQVELIKTLFSQLPPQVEEALLAEMYYDKFYKGELYKLQHCIMKDDIRYFANYETMIEFFKSICLQSDNTYLDFMNPGYIARKIKNREPLLGYYITKEVKE